MVAVMGVTVTGFSVWFLVPAVDGACVSVFVFGALLLKFSFKVVTHLFSLLGRAGQEQKCAIYMGGG